MYVCALYACSASENERRALDSLSVEFQIVVNHHVGTENQQTHLLCKRNSAHHTCVLSPTPILHSFYVEYNNLPLVFIDNYI